MSQSKQNIVQEFFGKLFNTVNVFIDGVFQSEISDAILLNSDDVREVLFKTKQKLVNLTKENLVKATSKGEFLQITKQSFNDFVVEFNGKLPPFSMLEVSLKNHNLFNEYISLFEISEQDFLDIKDAIIVADGNKAPKQGEQQAFQTDKGVKIEAKLEPETPEEKRQKLRTTKILERVERLFQKFGEVFTKIFKSEGMVLVNMGVKYQGKVDVERSGQLAPSLGIPTRNRGQEKDTGYN